MVRHFTRACRSARLDLTRSADASLPRLKVGIIGLVAIERLPSGARLPGFRHLQARSMSDRRPAPAVGAARSTNTLPGSGS